MCELEAVWASSSSWDGGEPAFSRLDGGVEAV